MKAEQDYSTWGYVKGIVGEVLSPDSFDAKRICATCNYKLLNITGGVTNALLAGLTAYGACAVPDINKPALAASVYCVWASVNYFINSK